jgi:hypothetical protein
MKMTLCKTCNIRHICHEPEKGNAEESCQYFQGEYPEGYAWIYGALRKLHEGKWKAFKFFVIIDGKKEWVSDWQIDRMKMEEKRQRRRHHHHAV